MILYRPIGEKEKLLLQQTDFTAFPPRLPEQPIFYPVLNERYASEIAQRWNASKESEHKGYVTQFEIDDAFAGKYEIHTVGASYHQELWIPAEELSEFNRHIIGIIRIIRSYAVL